MKYAILHDARSHTFFVFKKNEMKNKVLLMVVVV